MHQNNIILGKPLSDRMERNESKKGNGKDDILFLLQLISDFGRVRLGRATAGYRRCGAHGGGGDGGMRRKEKVVLPLGLGVEGQTQKGERERERERESEIDK